MGMGVGINVENSETEEIGRIYETYERLLGRFYCREEGESLLYNIIRQGGKSSFIHRKSELVEKLCKAGVDANIDMSIDELKVCVKKLPDGGQMDRQMFDVLYGFYREFKTPARQIKDIVRRLGEKKYQDSSVRLSILKQFIKNTDYHTGPVKEMIRMKIHTETGDVISRKNTDREKMADCADESLFDVLNKKLTKAEKKKYALLRLCDDLALGRFRTNGSTRLSLYMFAFAFNMAFYPDTAMSDYDPDLDIEKNLFFDYYENHLLRFLDENEEENMSDYESAPSGEGINYKNYAEVIYLYYLNRKDIKPYDRIKKAEAMIETCRQRVKEKEVSEDGYQDDKSIGSSEGYTYIYKDYFFEIIYKMSEEEIPDYISSHYCLYEDNDNISGTKLMLASENVTAKYHFITYMKKISIEQDIDNSEVEDLLVENKNWDPEYIKLIRRLNDMLHPEIRIGNTHFTRDEMIAVFYNYCIQNLEQEGMSLKELYEDCCQKLNPVLVDSRFQPLKITNVFDIFMVVMLYRYLNIV